MTRRVRRPHPTCRIRAGRTCQLVWDFGITKVLDETNKNVASRTMSSGDNVRHDAPELTETKGVFATKRLDIYSLAMSMLQLFAQDKTKCPPRPDEHDPRNRVSDGGRKWITCCWNLALTIDPRWKGSRFLPKPTRSTIGCLCRTFVGKSFGFALLKTARKGGASNILRTCRGERCEDYYVVKCRHGE